MGIIYKEPRFYPPNTKHWLYFGWENDSSKSLSTMGGTLYPGGANGEQKKDVKPVSYTVTLDGTEYCPDEISENRKKNTLWYQADGFMNSPVSHWKAGNTGLEIKIQHIASRILQNTVTAVFTRVTLINTTFAEKRPQLNVSAPASVEVPLYGAPVQETENYAVYAAVVPANSEVELDFAAAADGKADPEVLKLLGTFDDQYAFVKGYYDGLLFDKAQPVSLPNQKIVDFYRNSMLVMLQTMVHNKRLCGFRGIRNVKIGTKEKMSEYEIALPGNTGIRDFICKVENAALSEAQQLTFEVDADAACGEYEIVVLADSPKGREAGSCLVTPENYQSQLEIALDQEPLKDAKTIFFVSRVNEKSVYTDEYEMRGSGGNRAGCFQYNQYFSHDVPNMVEQYIREGNIGAAKRIMSSSYYQSLAYTPDQLYLDAIPKFILPYAMLWQVSSDEERAGYFTENIKSAVQAASKKIEEYMTGPKGLMAKSNTMDNGKEYMLVDNLAVMHGYAAYEYLCKEWNWPEEAQWAADRKRIVNDALNEMLEIGMKRRGAKNWYMSCLEDGTVFYAKHKTGEVPYEANWIATSFMMSTFPWDAKLRGYDLGGIWDTCFDSSLDYALELKKQMKEIPEGSWGAWWKHLYGSVYNAGISIQTLYSEKHRTIPLRSLDWLFENESAPFQWGENYDGAKYDGDWSIPATDYETWGLGFSRQCLLESTVSMKTDGTAIIGRGLINSWLHPDTPIEWKNISVNHGRKWDSFKIFCPDLKTICVEISGDDTEGDIVVNIPAMVQNIQAVSAGIVDQEAGTVTLPGSCKKITVELKNTIV